MQFRSTSRGRARGRARGRGGRGGDAGHGVGGRWECQGLAARSRGPRGRGRGGVAGALDQRRVEPIPGTSGSVGQARFVPPIKKSDATSYCQTAAE